MNSFNKITLLLNKNTFYMLIILAVLSSCKKFKTPEVKTNTIKNLIENLEKDNKCLNDITTGKNGKTRRLNKNCIINIFNYLLQKENEIVISE